MGLIRDYGGYRLAKRFTGGGLFGSLLAFLLMRFGRSVLRRLEERSGARGADRRAA